MATQKEIDNASKLTALTYMVAGCLGYSIENLLKYLDVVNLRLSGQEKMLVEFLKALSDSDIEVHTHPDVMINLDFKDILAKLKDTKLGDRESYFYHQFAQYIC